jgi:hypothetical protein
MNVRTCVVAATLWVSVSGCMAWHPTELDGPRITPEEFPERVRITREDSSRVVLDFAALEADSITGMVEAGGPTSIALSDVQRLERWALDPGFIFVPALVAGIVFISNFPLDDPQDRDIP